MLGFDADPSKAFLDGKSSNDFGAIEAQESELQLAGVAYFF